MNPTVQLIEEMTDRALGRTDGQMLLSTATERAVIRAHIDELAKNASVAEMPTPPGRGRLVKRLILKVGGFTFARQQASNQALIGALTAVNRELETIDLQLAHEWQRSTAAVEAFEQRLVELGEVVDEQHRRLAELSAELLVESTRRQALERELVAQRPLAK